MAIDDLPLPVVNFLNVLGIPWPYINEDTLIQFASLVRQFRQAIITTHQDATESVSNISKAHKGASTEVMTSGWAKLTASQVGELTTACTVFADALDAGAGYIVAQKGIAIADLFGMATAFFADQAAAIASFGLAEAALPVIEEAAVRIVKSLEMDLEQYIVGTLIGAGAKPLIAKIKSMMSGLDWSQSGGTAGPQKGVSVSPAAVFAQTTALRSQAATLRSNAASISALVRELKF